MLSFDHSRWLEHTRPEISVGGHGGFSGDENASGIRETLVRLPQFGEDPQHPHARRRTHVRR